jgi:hypothetical protein
LEWYEVNGGVYNKVSHITGSKDGEFLCMDPLNEKQVEAPLSRYGNRICAVRYIAERNG